MGHILRLWVALLGICLALLLPASPAVAATAELTPCISAVRAGDKAGVMIANPDRFDCQTEQNQLDPGDYWVRMAVPASTQSAGKRMIFRTASLWDHGFKLWALRGGGQIEAFDPYQAQDISPMRLGATAVVTLPANDQPVMVLLAKVDRSAVMRGVMRQSQLSPAEDALRYETMLAALYAALVGICIALLVYNIALWRGMRERFLLAYCGMLVATLAYGIFTSGAPHYLSPEMTGADRLRITTPLLAINGASAIIFIRFFFDGSQLPRWLVRLTYAHAAWISVFAIGYAMVLPAYVKQLDTIYALGFLPLPLFVLAYAVVAYKRHNPFLGYFLIAWSMPAAATIVRALHGLDIVPYHILIENSSLIGLAFEALVSSLAIGHRVRLLAQARDRAEIAEASAMLIADTDALTGLLNRRAFVREIMAEPGHWRLTLIDIDHFKRVNDALGHDGGDDVLVRLSSILIGNTPDQSLVARLGGEEFGIATAGQVPTSFDPDQLLAVIRSTPMLENYHITASCGSAERMLAFDTDWKTLYKAADMALYKAKSGGRDQHIVYAEDRAAA